MQELACDLLLLARMKAIILAKAIVFASITKGLIEKQTTLGVVLLILFFLACGIEFYLFNKEKLTDIFHQHVRLNQRKSTVRCSNDISEDPRGKSSTPTSIRYVSEPQYQRRFKMFRVACVFVGAFTFGLFPAGQ